MPFTHTATLTDSIYIQSIEEDKRALEECLKNNENDALKLLHHEGLLNTREENKLLYKKN